MKVPKDFQTALWSYDADQLDTEKNQKEIITQVLNYGTWENLKLLFKIYPEETIKSVVQNPSRGVWFGKVLNFWTIIFGVKLEKEVKERAFFRLAPWEEPR